VWVGRRSNPKERREAMRNALVSQMKKKREDFDVQSSVADRSISMTFLQAK